MDILSRFERITEHSPDHPAFIEASGICRFRDLTVRAQCCATYLIHLGISTGDRCMVLEENSANTAAVILAIWYCGAIPVLLHSQSTDAHVTHAITRTQAKLIVAATEPAPVEGTATTHCCSADALIAASAALENVSTLSGLYRASATMIASIVFTSGSSGGPKGVAQTHQSLISGCNAVFQCLDYRATDTMLCPVPWSFDYGFGQLLTTLQTGITQIIPPGNSPFELCSSLETHKPSILVGVPALLSGLCQGLSPIATTDTTSVRLITSTGSKLHASTLSAMSELFPDSSVSLNYGLTETYRSTSLPIEAVKAHSGSVGLAIPGVTISVLREDHSIADPGEVGEIVHSGGGVFSGYWGDPARTQAVRRADPLWILDAIQAPPAVFTGDLGWKDEKGYLYIRGRKDRQIKTMGILVNPDEIETLVLNHTHIQEVAILSKSHEMLGELIIAVYQLKADTELSVKELKAFCRREMTPYMLPREFHRVEAMPRTSSGKVDYTQLRALYSQNKS